MKQSCIIFGFLFCYTLSAQIESPYDFLDLYTEKFTPHHRIEDYAAYLAEKSDYVDLVYYGKSYQNRPLFYLIISAPENIQNADQIRRNHGSYTGTTDTRFGEEEHAIVWVSHGVHGNEAGATESALTTMYKLADPNDEIQTWLKDVIVILNPCMNPDGYDRYVHFYNSNSGQNPNPNPNSFEHQEPWPTGRVNHYHFDLNRDWAWQTQVESQQNVKAYRRWMPHIHVDVHEQFPENPYYFAPAAKPYHPSIKDWQIDLQMPIGKNNAKYFDEQGWLYFTKQVFDLFYPSYGDTYPIFSGAIGMTYEQAGHGIAGIEYLLKNADTLKISDRIAHHSTAVMATIESTYKLKDSLIELQQAYFTSFENEVEGYVYAPQSLSLRDELVDLLHHNGIDFAYFTKDLNLESIDEEEVKVEKGDLCIPAQQANANLLQVLMDPEPELHEANTYDITSWSLKHAYGDMHAIASLPSGSLDVRNLEETVPNYWESKKSYVISLRTLKDYFLVINAMEKGLQFRIASKEFTTINTAGDTSSFPKGSLLVLHADNKNINADLSIELPPLFEVKSTWSVKGPDLGSHDYTLLKKPQIALLRHEQIDPYSYGFWWHFLDQRLSNSYEVLAPNQLWENLDAYNIIVLPESKLEIEDKHQNKLAEWVKAGGKLIAIGKSAHIIKAFDGFELEFVELENSSSFKFAEHNPGAVIRAELKDKSYLSYGLENYYQLITNDFAFSQNDSYCIDYERDSLELYGSMGMNVEERLKMGCIIQEKTIGKGSVLLFANDPLYRGFWVRGQVLVMNAILFNDKN